MSYPDHHEAMEIAINAKLASMARPDLSASLYSDETVFVPCKWCNGKGLTFGSKYAIECSICSGLGRIAVPSPDEKSP